MEQNEINSLNQDRFNFSKKGFSIVDEGEKIPYENLREYFDTKKRMMLKVTQELKEGDIVILQVTGKIVEIKEINVLFEGKIISKYGGIELNSKSENNEIILFDQEDIGEILSKNNYNNGEYKNKSR